jgi:hypothetical protein
MKRRAYFSRAILPSPVSPRSTPVICKFACWAQPPTASVDNSAGQSRLNDATTRCLKIACTATPSALFSTGGRQIRPWLDHRRGAGWKGLQEAGTSEPVGVYNRAVRKSKRNSGKMVDSERPRVTPPETNCPGIVGEEISGRNWLGAFRRPSWAWC